VAKTPRSLAERSGAKDHPRKVGTGSMSDENTMGMVGRVSVPIPANGPGEIILSIRNGSEAFTAYTQGGEVLDRNSRAVVVEQTGPRTVLVTGC
jgi:hypothetical protein